MTKEQAVSLWQSLVEKKNHPVHAGIKVLKGWSSLPSLEECMKKENGNYYPKPCKKNIEAVIEFFEEWKSALIDQLEEAEADLSRMAISKERTTNEAE